MSRELFFQQQRDVLAAVHEAWDESVKYDAELRQRLEDLDELAESIAFEQSGADIQHRYSGQPVPWMQQRIGEHVRAVRVAADRLRVSAEDLTAGVNADGGMARLAHMARGYLAIVAEAQRVVASYRPDRELVQVDWARVDAVAEGIRRLDGLYDVEHRRSMGLVVQDHEREQAERRAAGFHQLADRIDADPDIQLALQDLRAYAKG